MQAHSRVKCSSLLLMLARSGYIKIILMLVTARQIVKALCSIFYCRLPHQLNSDIRPEFMAEEFAQYLKSNIIKKSFSALYHSSSNGLSKRFIQTVEWTCMQDKRMVFSFIRVCQNFCSYISSFLMPPPMHYQTNCFCIKNCEQVLTFSSQINKDLWPCNLPDMQTIPSNRHILSQVRLLHWFKEKWRDRETKRKKEIERKPICIVLLGNFLSQPLSTHTE